jgi:hypothetical protein
VVVKVARGSADAGERPGSRPGAGAGGWPGGGCTQRGGGRTRRGGGVDGRRHESGWWVAGPSGDARPGGGWWRYAVGGGRDNFGVFEREEVPWGACG